MAASGKPGFDRIYPPAVSGFVKLPFNQIEAVPMPSLTISASEVDSALQMLDAALAQLSWPAA